MIGERCSIVYNAVYLRKRLTGKMRVSMEQSGGCVLVGPKRYRPVPAEKQTYFGGVRRKRHGLQCESYMTSAKRLDESLLGGGPSGSSSHHDTTGNGHGSDTSCALEERTRDSASAHSAKDVVLATNTVNGSIDKVVDEGNDTCRVTEESTTTSDLVENSVESETESRVVDTKRTEESFPSTEKTSDHETREVGGAGTVAEVIRPATGRNSSSCTLHAGWRTIGEIEVFEVILSKTSQRREGSEVKRRIAKKRCRAWDVF